MKHRNVAFSADYGYINQVTTAIKSLLYHNHNVEVYVINTNIPQEWFNNINNRIRSINCHITNCCIDNSLINNEHVSQPQINALSYGRILIPRLIPNKQVLYLDSDLVVNHNLDSILNLDLNTHPLAAVPDVIYHGDFNSGVVIFNNNVLNQQDDNIVDQMLKFGQKNDLPEGDQSVLNHFFKESYLHLGFEYNYVIGYDFLNFYYKTDYDLFENFKGLTPKIIHFTGPQKPWECVYSGRLRNTWWQYANLSWREVVNHDPLPRTIDYEEIGQCLTFTSDENLLHLQELAEKLPNVTFNVAAWTIMGGNLMKLIGHSNIHLYPSVVGPDLDRLIDNAKCYLDINYGPKEEKVMDNFIKPNKFLFAFKDTLDKKYDDKDDAIFEDNDVDAMANAIRTSLK